MFEDSSPSPPLAAHATSRRIFLTEIFKRSTGRVLATLPSRLPREGGSAMLLEEGTLANQALVPIESSKESSFATRLEPGSVRARPAILTSLVALLST